MPTEGLWLSNWLRVSACASALVISAGAFAETEKPIRLDIAATDLGDALNQLKQQTGRQIIFASNVTQGKSTPALHGTYVAYQALDVLLKNSGLTYEVADNSAIVVSDTNKKASTLAQVDSGGEQSPHFIRTAEEQTSQGTSNAKEAAPSSSLEEVEVTGTRIQQNGFDTPTPVTVMSAQQLEVAQPQSVASALVQLPQFLGNQTNTQSAAGVANIGRGDYLNLRNVGVQRNLILMDGERLTPSSQQGYVDTDVIPDLLVSRVDVVTAGVSAVYGADAVSGVVNYIIDRNFTGVKAIAQGSITGYGDGKGYRVGAAMGTGFADNRGHLLLSLERNVIGSVDAAKRSLATQYWASGSLYAKGQKEPNGQIAGAPGSANNPFVFAPNANYSAVAPNGLIYFGPASLAKKYTFNNQGIEVPFQAGTPFPTGSTLEIGGQGETLPLTSITAENQRTNAFAHFSYDLTDNVRFFTQFIFQQASSHWMSQDDSTLIPIFSGNAYLDPAVQAVLSNPALNTGNLSGAVCGAPGGLCLGKFPIDNRELEEQEHVNDHYYLAKAGFEGKIFGDWNWNLDYIYGHSATKTDEREENLQHLLASVDAVTNPATGQIACRVNVIDPGVLPGCVPYNPMVFGGEAPAQIGWIMGDSIFETTYKTNDVIFNLTGKPIRNWAGPIGLAAGLEYRDASLVQTSNSSPQTPFDTTGLRGVTNTLLYSSLNVAQASGKENVKEANVEVDFPVLKDKFFAKSLDLALAGRVTDYSTSGSVNTWKVGVTYDPIPDLRLRATRSRDIRAPTLFDLFSAQTQGQGGLNDAHCGCASAKAVLTSSGGNPNLEPEIGNMFTAGTIITPKELLPRFTMSVDYYDLKITNAITTLSTTQIDNICEASGGTSPVCANIIRPFPFSDHSPDNTPTAINTEEINAAFFRTNGLDVEVAYATPAHFTFRFLGNYTLDYQSQIGPGQQTYQSAGYINPLGSNVPHFRGNLSAMYANGPFSVFFQVRAIGSAKLGGPNEPTEIFATKSLPATYYSDLTLSYNFKVGGGDRPTNLVTFLTINNLFNQQPRLYPGGVPGLALPTIPSLYDVVGINFTAGVRLRY